MMQGLQSAKHPVIQKFYDPSEVERAVDAAGISLSTEIELLKKAMEHPDVRIQLKAQAQWRNLIKDIRQASSVFLTITKHGDGTIEQSATCPAIIDTLRKENTSAPQEAVTHEFHPPTPSGLGIDPYSQILRARKAAENALGDPQERDLPHRLPDRETDQHDPQPLPNGDLPSRSPNSD